MFRISLHSGGPRPFANWSSGVAVSTALTEAEAVTILQLVHDIDCSDVFGTLVYEILTFFGILDQDYLIHGLIYYALVSNDFALKLTK